MPIPNTITRTLDLAHPQEKVWGALSTLEGLTGWFGTKAEGEVAPGHDVLMRWEQFDGEQTLAIKVVDPMSVFAYCWGINGAPEGDPRRTYVEFALEPRLFLVLWLGEAGQQQVGDRREKEGRDRRKAESADHDPAEGRPCLRSGAAGDDQRHPA